MPTKDTSNFDHEVYGQIRGLLEAWFNYGTAYLSETELTPKQVARLRQLANQLSLNFVLAHHQSPMLDFIAKL